MPVLYLALISSISCLCFISVAVSSSFFKLSWPEEKKTIIKTWKKMKLILRWYSEELSYLTTLLYVLLCLDHFVAFSLTQLWKKDRNENIESKKTVIRFIQIEQKQDILNMTKLKINITNLSTRLPFFHSLRIVREYRSFLLKK